MATQYSDHFASSQPGLAIASPAVKIPWGVNNRHMKRATVTLDLAPDDFGIGDVARMFTCKSSDRITELLVTAAGGTAVAADCGAYLAGSNHDGAVVDADEFGSAVSLAGTVALTDIFAEAVAAETVRRGMPLWERLGLSSDPGVEYDICFTATAALTTADAVVTLIAYGSFS